MGLFGNIFGDSSSSSPTHFDRSVARSVPLVQDESGASATNLQTIEDKGGVSLRKKTEAVTVSLRKRNMSGIRAQVAVVLDHSGSMSRDYERGVVQELTERFLAFGLTVDIDGEIPVIPFDSRVKPTVDVNMSNYQDIVKNRIYNRAQMGSTDLASALKEVRKLAQATDAPLYVAIVTDGEPDDRTEARELIKDLSRYPVFIKFIAVQRVSFLEDLDDMDDSLRLLDNVDAKFYPDVAKATDSEFAEDMADEWDTWVAAALSAGVLTK